MSLQIDRCTRNATDFDRNWIERIILQLADAFNIRIAWDWETGVLTGVFAVAGGVVGCYAGGRVGAAIGAGIGGATGLGVSTVISLRQIWKTVKEKLSELFYIVFNYLRRLDHSDYERAYRLLKACAVSRRELVLTILDFIAYKLGREVYSNITISPHSAVSHIRS